MKYLIKHIITLLMVLISNCSFAQTNEYSKSECDTNLYAPNTLNPNGDGLNDTFFVRFLKEKSKNFQLVIYDRWGEIIFESNDINIGWDGNLKNKGAAQQGVYVWKANYYYKIGGEKLSCVGQVSLIR